MTWIVFQYRLLADDAVDEQRRGEGARTIMKQGDVLG